MRSLLTLFIISFVSYTYGQTDTTCNICALEEKAINARIALEEDTAVYFFKQLLKLDPDNFQATWSLAYYHALKGRRSEEETYRLAQYDTSRLFADKAYAIDSNDEHACYVMALAMGIVAEIAGPTERIAASKKIKYYAERAIDINPNYSKPWYILGRWHHAVANLSWLEVIAADLLFGGAPEGATDEDALKCMKKAVQLEPGSFLYYHGLALAYEALDEEEEAIKVLKEALQLPLIEKDSEVNKKRCEDLLQDLD